MSSDDAINDRRVCLRALIIKMTKRVCVFEANRKNGMIKYFG